MFQLFQDLSTSWLESSARILDGFRRGALDPYPVHEDPAPVTPYQVIYKGGKTSLRYYHAVGKAQATPLLIVYALIKRPFVLDLQPELSVIKNLTQQGFEVYLLDWIPPTQADTWRGFDAYVNGDVANAVQAVQTHSGAQQISLLGYCFGGLLSTIYTVLHPHAIKNFIPLSVPVDMSKQDVAIFDLMKTLDPNLVAGVFGNCPAWIMKMAFSAMSPVHHLLNKHVGLYRNRERPGFADTFALFERWMNSDVPLAGQIFREVTTDIFRGNLLTQGKLMVGGQRVDLKNIRCPVLNVVGEHDDVVHPRTSLPLFNLIGSRDKQNLVFPAGHIGVVVSSSAQKHLWPRIGSWLKKHDRKPRTRKVLVTVQAAPQNATTLQ
ncbi:MAG: alpha/beta fold hydrolase [Deltaproteobacteria bacterium]|nr:alpha/beta fold hydrolase [Deltaproteobacteria bacterium]